MPYLNRELSWLDFNARVLEEAFKKENPIFERLRFLAITASNLDEFFMVRVAGVMEQVRSKYTTPDLSGLTPQQLLSSLREKLPSSWKNSIPALTVPFFPFFETRLHFCRPRGIDRGTKTLLTTLFYEGVFSCSDPSGCRLEAAPSPCSPTKASILRYGWKKAAENRVSLSFRFPVFCLGFWKFQWRTNPSGAFSFSRMSSI